jgi:ParB family transcriptional regulator, chromosome partitioning protein
LLARRINNSDYYELIAGERRLRASILANLQTVPCIVLDCDYQDSAVISILENIQRANLNFFEEALAIAHLHEHFGLTQQEIGKKLGKSQSALSNKLRLLRLPADVRYYIEKEGLGKGLGQLFLENSVDELVANNTLPLEEIVPNKEQPRKTFDETALEELAESIRQHGVLQPLLVRPLPGGGYQLVAGERRYRASRIAGLREVPVVIRELSDVETMEIAIIENLQREDLNPIEEAEGLQALIDRCGFTQDQVAASVGKSRPAIANSLRLLKLPPEVREMTKSGAISAGHARALLGLPNEALIYAAAEQIVSHKLTVRDVEKLAKRSQQEAGAAPKPRSRRDAFYDEVELALKETLGRKVRVVPGRGKGTLGSMILGMVIMILVTCSFSSLASLVSSSSSLA